MTSLARRYAGALFEVAEQKGVVEKVAADLAAIDDALADPQVQAVVRRPDLSAQTIAKFFPGAGNAISAGVAGAGTTAMGQSAIKYFLRDSS